MQSTVCSASAERCLSKSNMALPIAVGEVEITADVLTDRRLKRREAGIIAGAAQVLDTALGEVLILAADRVRHLDIFDIGRPAERLEHGADHVAKAFGLAGADIKDATDRGRVEQPAQHRNGVVQ